MRGIITPFGALLVAAALCVSAAAQTSPAGFVASSDVVAINCGGSWSAGNLTTEAYDFLDYGAKKSDRLFLQGVELTAPGCGLSVFGGGAIWQPDITALLSKTNITAGNFVVFLDGSAGNGIPSTGTNRITALLGGGAKYILSDNLTWNTVRCDVVFFGSNRYPACSMGLSAYFGGTPASAAVSSNVKRSLVKRIASATARLAAKQ